EPDRFAENGRIAVEPGLPETVGQHGRAGGVGAIVPRVEQSAKHWVQPITSKYDPPTTTARTSRGSPRPTMVKAMVEKSPNALSVLTRARRSWISGTENGTLSAPMPRALWRM